MLSKDAAEAQKKHPVAWWSLLLAALTPIVLGITVLGALLKQLWPSPTAWQIVAGACVLIVPIPLFVCIGAAAWLLLARRVVPRAVARAFFVHSGFGIVSRVSERMFVSAYGKERR